MKKIFLIISLLASSLFAEIVWLKYDDAVEQVKKNNKIIMVMLSREDCPTCEYMEDIVFEDKKVLEEFNKDFIGVHLDIHNDFIPEGLTYIGTPTFHFLNKFERRLDRLDGGANAKDFMDKLKEVKTKH
ncbi:thioredoxin family protein [bacterium]|nr:thioredoxin family protein [bacterium]MBU1993792.1 thioredoxin family protein [bacterium]